MVFILGVGKQVQLVKFTMAKGDGGFSKKSNKDDKTLKGGSLIVIQEIKENSFTIIHNLFFGKYVQILIVQ